MCSQTSEKYHIIIINYYLNVSIFQIVYKFFQIAFSFLKKSSYKLCNVRQIISTKSKNYCDVYVLSYLKILTFVNYAISYIIGSTLAHSITLFLCLSKTYCELHINFHDILHHKLNTCFQYVSFYCLLNNTTIDTQYVPIFQCNSIAS